MNSLIFEEVLYDMNNYFRAQDKKILLLVDNAPSHFNPHYLSADQDEDEENEIASTSGKFAVYS